MTQRSTQTGGRRAARRDAELWPGVGDPVRLWHDLLPGHSGRTPEAGPTFGEPVGAALYPVNFLGGRRTLTCLLPARTTSVRLARNFTRDALRGWAGRDLVDPLTLVVSELVTNALRHGFPESGDAYPACLDEVRAPAVTAAVAPIPPVHGPSREEDARIQMGLLHTWSCAMCAVWDPSDALPVRRRPDAMTESGRGLGLVESLSHAWGFLTFRDGEHRAGKAVWALLRPRP